MHVAEQRMRPPTPTPGPWAGAMVWATSDGICMKSTNEKWNKAKALIHQLQQELREIQGEPYSQGINKLQRARECKGIPSAYAMDLSCSDPLSEGISFKS